jgi:hypothetical protein
MELSFQEWGTVAEIFGALAVIVSLLYVAVQIKQNNRINQGIAIQQTYASTQEIYSWYANNSDANELLAKFSQGETLTLPEFVRIQSLMMGMVEQYEVYFILNKLKMMDEETFHSFFKKLATVLGTPSARQWFTDNRTYFRRDFVEFVNNFLDGNPKLIRATSRFYGLESKPA